MSQRYGLYGEWKDSESDSCISAQSSVNPLHGQNYPYTAGQLAHSSINSEAENSSEKVTLDRLMGFMDKRGNFARDGMT